MNRFLGKLIASAAAAAAVGVIAAVYNNRKDANEEVKKDDAASDDDAVSFIDIEDGGEPAVVMQSVLKNCKKVEDDCEIFL